jgi:RNA polymerase sigma-70 factor (ECF subfamily)
LGARSRRPHDLATDEQQLALQLGAGDEGATRTAWDHFSPLVRRILRRALGPGADVEDVVQEVFLRFFESVGGLRQHGALRGFLVAITVNALRGELRRRRVRRIVRFVDPAELPELRVVDADPEARAALERFYAILDRLRQGDRIAFSLRVIEGMPLSEVASALKVSIPTARRRIARARQRVVFHVERDPLLSRYAAAGDAP